MIKAVIMQIQLNWQWGKEYNECYGDSKANSFKNESCTYFPNHHLREAFQEETKTSLFLLWLILSASRRAFTDASVSWSDASGISFIPFIGCEGGGNLNI